MEVLNLKNVSKIYDSTDAIKDIDISISKGEIVSIIGPSGSGKSTLLRCIKGLTRISDGDIELHGNFLVKDGHYIKHRDFINIQSSIGMVFQNFNLFPNMTALENVIYALLHVKKLDKKEAIKKGEELLCLMGLSDKSDQYPIQLSGGEKQRVAIARSMAMEPEIILFDEPTSALDPESTVEVLKAIKTLASKDVTMLIVTHEMSFAREISHKIIFMDNGNIIQKGLPDEIFMRSENERIRKFLAV